MNKIVRLALIAALLAFAAACESTPTSSRMGTPSDSITPAGSTQGRTMKNSSTTSDAPVAPGT